MCPLEEALLELLRKYASGMKAFRQRSRAPSLKRKRGRSNSEHRTSGSVASLSIPF